MTQTVIRECSINDVPVLVRIAHGHLDPAYRVETSSESREKISFHIAVQWSETAVENFNQLFNYASLYRILQAMHDRVVTGPLEGVIDEVETAIRIEAASQGIVLVQTVVTLQRPDLLHGFVRLSKTASYT